MRFTYVTGSDTYYTQFICTKKAYLMTVDSIYVLLYADKKREINIVFYDVITGTLKVLGLIDFIKLLIRSNKFEI